MNNHPSVSPSLTLPPARQVRLQGQRSAVQVPSPEPGKGSAQPTHRREATGRRQPGAHVRAQLQL